MAADLTDRLHSFTDTVESDRKKHSRNCWNSGGPHLQERLDKLLGNVQLDPARLVQEIAIIADKTDVTEEIVRLRCHINQFTLFLAEERRCRQET